MQLEVDKLKGEIEQLKAEIGIRLLQMEGKQKRMEHLQNELRSPQSPAPKSVQLRVPKKFIAKIGSTSVTVVEYSFRSRRMPNGYWVTMAAIVLPDMRRMFLGASACSPEDKFNRREAAARSIGRARQQALYALAGWGVRPTLLTPNRYDYCTDEAGVFNMADTNVHDINAKSIEAFARQYEMKVAMNAEAEYIRMILLRLRRAHPNFKVSITDTSGQ